MVDLGMKSRSTLLRAALELGNAATAFLMLGKLRVTPVDGNISLISGKH